MKILKVYLLSFALLFAFGVVSAQEVDVTTTIALDEEVTAEDLNIAEPNLLPDSPFYFFKNWGRTIQSVFTFDPVKKAELRERFANEKLIELKKVAGKTQNTEVIKKATENYQAEVRNMERVTVSIRETAQENEEVGKFLDKFIQQQTLHQRVLQKLEDQVPAEAFAKIAEAREAHIEKFGQVMTRLENKEKIQERLENNLQQVKGSEFKDFKNLEVLKDLEEKVPEIAKEAIQNVRANTLIKLKEKVKELSAEKIEQFQAYTEAITGVKEKQVEILDNLREELKAKPIIREKLIETRDNVIETIRIRAEDRACPQIEKPAADFCSNGRIIIKKDDAGCVIGFSCVRPTDTSAACTYLWEPVCGQNGRTYSNKCFAEQAGVKIAYRGQCKKTECKQDADCPKTRCIGAASKCIDGECIVPRCIEPLPTEPGTSEKETIEAEPQSTEREMNILQKNIIEPIKKLIPVQ